MRFLPLALLVLLSVNSLAQLQTCQHVKSHTKYQFGTVGNDYQSMMRDYDVHWYYLNLEASNMSTDISGFTTVGAMAKNTLDTIILELVSSLDVDSVIYQGQSTPYTHHDGVVDIPLSNSIAATSNFEVTIHYHGTASSSGAGLSSGMSNRQSPTWGANVTWTLSEPYGASEWFAVKQDLRDQADSVWVFVTVDTSLKVGSNGLLTAITPVDSIHHRFEWKTHYPTAFYLISIAVADYYDYSFYSHPAGSDSILIQNYIYDNPATLNAFQQDIDETSDMMEVFAEKYGTYPFHEEKYGHSMAPFSGGMEHQTMTTQGFFNFNLTAHELGHQWFGDHVTCGSWKDLWINEGFATYSEFIALEELHPASAMQEILTTQSSAMSVSSGSVYVDDTADVGRLFSSQLTYNKGACILHMMRYEVNNDSIFFEALREYQRRFSFQTAKGEDFKTVLEDVSGIQFDTFFDQWYYGEGFPGYDIDWEWHNGNLYLEVDQFVSAPNATMKFEGHVDILVELDNGSDTLLRVWMDTFKHIYSFKMPEEVNDIRVDPHNWLLDEPGDIDEVSGLSGLEERIQSAFYLAPNPARDEFYVVTEYGGETQLRLFDIHGKLIMSRAFEQKVILDRGTIPAGIYTLTLVRENVTETRKLILE